ncbi:SpoIIE family protein phosphatase [bacterium]|nr:SpoIIE family protein phosphatase [bacterium]
MNSTLTRTEDLEQLLDTLRTHRARLADTGQVENPADLAAFLAVLDDRLSQLVLSLNKSLEFELLRKTALLLARAVEQEEVLAAMLDGLKQVLPYDAGGIYLVDSTPPKVDSGDENGTSAPQDGIELSALLVRGYDEEGHRKFKQKLNEGVVGWVIANGRSQVVDDTQKDDRYIELRPGTRSEIAVPIITRDTVIGAINLEADRVAAFPEESLSLLENLSSYATVALERARIHRQLMEARGVERELEIAREIQKKLLPVELPKLPNFELAGLNVPSEFVGGDYFDFIPLTDKDIGIVIADVAGKGFAAGLVMASLRSALRMRVETTYSIRTVMGIVNRFLYDSTGPERYVTTFYGVLDSLTGRFTYVNAGHNAPFLIHADNRVVQLTTGGPLLGVIREAEYAEAIAELEPGALLILYTDGIAEAGGDHGEEFGEDRIIQLALAHKDKPAEEIARTIERAAVKFHGNASPIDDRTVLVVKHL